MGWSAQGTLMPGRGVLWGTGLSGQCVTGVYTARGVARDGEATISKRAGQEGYAKCGKAMKDWFYGFKLSRAYDRYGRLMNIAM
jgi:hypothetical protein